MKLSLPSSAQAVRTRARCSLYLCRPYLPPSLPLSACPVGPRGDFFGLRCAHFTHPCNAAAWVLAQAPSFTMCSHRIARPYRTCHVGVQRVKVTSFGRATCAPLSVQSGSPISAFTRPPPFSFTPCLSPSLLVLVLFVPLVLLLLLRIIVVVVVVIVVITLVLLMVLPLSSSS